MNAFLCYSGQHSAFVLQVGSFLRRHFGDVFLYEEDQRADQDFNRTIDEKLKACDIFLVFAGSGLTRWQREEVDIINRLDLSDGGNRRKVITIAVGGQKTAEKLRTPEFPEWLMGKIVLPDMYTDGSRPLAAAACARDIVNELSIPWVAEDGLPYNPHLFHYEKDIIEFYLAHGLTLKGGAKGKVNAKVWQMLLDGCPRSWPTVQRLPAKETDYRNPLSPEESGNLDEDESKVVAAALTRLNVQSSGLYFPEARPRAQLRLPRGSRNNELVVGVLVLGGIAPGINTVIDAIVQRHWLYAEKSQYSLKMYGFLNGLWAFDDIINRTRLLRPDPTKASGANHIAVIDTAEHATDGGSMIGTWRSEELGSLETRPGYLREVVTTLNSLHVNILYVIGGDGSMKAAHAIQNVARVIAAEGKSKQAAEEFLSVVAVPKTMDNDILWMWQSFGFSSAVQKAREIVQQLHTEVKSNPRLCVLQLYGSDSGFVVSHTVLASASGHCDLALIPEDDFSMLDITMHLKKRMLDADRQLPYGLVVMAETAIPVDALECLGDLPAPACADVYQTVAEVLRAKMSPDEQQAIRQYVELRRRGKRIQGQTDDMLRQASLRLMMLALPILLKSKSIGTQAQNEGPDWERLRLVASEPRHLLRASAPSTSDITMAQRLGILAVDNAMGGYMNFMISQWLTEYVLVPLDLVVLGRKRIPRTGIFWKSVTAKTGQRSLSTA